MKAHSCAQPGALMCVQGWVDALHLLAHLAAHRRLGALNQALTTAAQRSRSTPWRP
jgi:hypothetical protein